MLSTRSRTPGIALLTALLFTAAIFVADGNGLEPRQAFAGLPPCPPLGSPTDQFPSVAEVTVSVYGLGADTITLSGPTTVARAPDGFGNIDTEIVSMTLTGTSPLLGNVTITEDPGRQSCGKVLAPLPPAPAQSFFDVFYIADVTQPAALTVTNAVPLTVSATAHQIPPIGDPYVFKGHNAFKPVGLIGEAAAGQPIGEIELVKHIPQPGQFPSWTIDETGVTSTFAGGPYHPADILIVPGGPPVVGIACAGLGLTSCAGAMAAVEDNLDALSYGVDFTDAFTTGYLGFSVAPGSVGLPGTAVAGEAGCAPPEPEADEFGTILNGSNYQIFDGDGVACDFNFAPPIMVPAVSESGPPHDDIDGLESLSTSFVDTNGDMDVFDPADGLVYFSLDPSSPTLPLIPAGPAHILMCGPPTTCSGAVPSPPVIYATPPMLGLGPGNDVDAICLFESSPGSSFGGPGAGDFLFYSLAPGSPALPGIPNPFVVGGVGASPADVIFVTALGAPVVIDPDFMLGLLSTDNLNALKCVKGLVDVAVAGAQLNGPITVSPQPSTPPDVTQAVGASSLYTVKEAKAYLTPPASPFPPVQVMQQHWWTVNVSNPARLRANWIPNPGDACTVQGQQVWCNDPGQNNKDDLHFNRMMDLLPGNPAQAVPPRAYQLTCLTAGTATVEVRLKQMPLGANDILAANNNVLFQYTVHCAPQDPSFSLKSPTETGFSGADILALNPVFGAPPVIGIPCGSLGLPGGCGNDIAALSYGTDTPDPAPLEVFFSVTGLSPPEGLTGTAVFTESTGCGVDQSYSDEYSSVLALPGVGGGNALVFDENGLADAGCGVGFPLGTNVGPLPGDDLDALVDLPPSFVDDGTVFGGLCGGGGGVAGDGLPDKPVYMSFTLASPLIGLVFTSTAAIGWSCGGASATYVATVPGLVGGPGCGPPACDAVDAMLLNEAAGSAFTFDPGDELWFSLGPGSPSLVALGATPADILYVSGAGVGPLVLYTADQLGLNGPLAPAARLTSAMDDLDALKGHLQSCDPTGLNSDTGPPPPAANTGTIDNGPGIAAVDDTVPNGDGLTDACDLDNDNDGLPDAQDVNPLLAVGICAAFAGSTDGHPSPAGGDVTDLDLNGPSWDTDGDGVRDGVECSLGTNPRSAASKPTAAACGGAMVDMDNDGLPARAERCWWGTSDTNVNSDGDGLKDCLETNDTNGDNVQNFPIDTINNAKAAFAIIVATIDFDLNGDDAVNFPGDTILSAKMAFNIGGICPP
jgi:hypothetical protein